MLERSCTHCGKTKLLTPANFRQTQAWFERWCRECRNRSEAARRRARRRGILPTRASLSERFFSKVEVGGPDECWLWTGAQNGTGYGRMWGGAEYGRYVYPHRVSYEIHVAPIPRDLTVDHLCCNRLCMNPRHMEIVAIGENVRRRSSRKRAEVA